jgi:hypothetical protein
MIYVVLKGRASRLLVFLANIRENLVATPTKMCTSLFLMVLPKYCGDFYSVWVLSGVNGGQFGSGGKIRTGCKIF